MNDNRNIDLAIDKLADLAQKQGANDAKAICASIISVEDHLAALCSEPRCKNYGTSIHCPPNVGGPVQFREILKEFKKGLFFKMDVPSDILYSDAGCDLFRHLHEMAAEIEQSAIKRGFKNSKAFAGGACKRLFCNDYSECIVLSENRKCRYFG